MTRTPGSADAPSGGHLLTAVRVLGLSLLLVGCAEVATPVVRLDGWGLELAVTPTRILVRSGTLDGESLWSFDGAELSPLEDGSIEHRDGVLLFGGRGGDVARVDPWTLEELYRLPVECPGMVLVAPDLLCHGTDGAVAVHDLVDGRLRGTLPPLGANLSVQALPGRRVVVSGSDGGVVVDLGTDPPSIVASVPDAPVFDGVFGSPPTHVRVRCVLFRIDTCPGPECLAEDGLLECAEWEPVGDDGGVREFVGVPNGDLYELLRPPCSDHACWRLLRYPANERTPQDTGVHFRGALDQVFAMVYDPERNELVVGGNEGCSWRRIEDPRSLFGWTPAYLCDRLAVYRLPLP